MECFGLKEDVMVMDTHDHRQTAGNLYLFEPN